MDLLLVDDEVSLRRTLRITLESMGHTVAEAATSEQARELVRGRDFDLTAAASHPALLGEGRHPSIPVSRLMRGTTRSSGRCLRVVISARIKVPLLRRMDGPCPTAQRYPLTVLASCSRLTLAA